MKNYLGIDIGGSHVTIGMVTKKESDRILNKVSSIPINSMQSADAILDLISNAIVQLLNDLQIIDLMGIGISIPGPFQYETGVSQIKNQNKYDHLYGLNIRASLANRLQQKLSIREKDIIFLNDAEAFLLGVSKENNWDEKRLLYGITLGTGLGSSILEHGEIKSNGKEVPIDDHLYSVPFKDGIAEDYISARWLVKRYNELSKNNGEAKSVKRIFEFDDRASDQVFREFGDNLGSLLSNTFDFFEADHIVIGGNIANASSRFEPHLKKKLKANGKLCGITFVSDTSSWAIKGVVEHMVAAGPSKIFRKERQSINSCLPVTKKDSSDDTYDIYPTFKIGENKIGQGFEKIVEYIANQDKVIIDGYSGVNWGNLVAGINRALSEEGINTNWYCADAAWKSQNQIKELISPFLGGDDPVFGQIYTGELKDFFDPKKLEYIQPESKGVDVIYGSGSYLVDANSPIIYVDVPKNEIQYRSRAGCVNNLASFGGNTPKEQYKRFYFVDWVVLNKHKKRILPDINILIDEQRIDEVTWIEGTVLRDALDNMSRNAFRVRPWFEPGVWGGQWMKDKISGLNKDAVNYAWSFECIAPENGIIFESDTRLLEVSFDFLMYQDNRAILGASADIFKDEFPIRFDFLDTVKGQNLSLQCHPTEGYMKEHFGESFTQDETYYILDATDEADIFLGFQEDINPQKFRERLEHSQKSKEAVEVQEYIQKFSASKHDFFLIPGGTVHCSGEGNLVLEISSTPYIYTFKMYDWLRLDLDGNPRPINIGRAFENLNFNRKGDHVEQELISSPVVIKQENDWELIHLPTHREHFYDVHRIDFKDRVEVETNNGFHLLSLVEGTSITVETSHIKQEIQYAETFIVPASAGKYTLINKGSSEAKVVKAFVKDEILSS